MNNLRKLFGIVSIIVIIVGAMTACDFSSSGSGGSGSVSDPISPTSPNNTYKPVEYTGYDADGTEYKLTITRTTSTSKAAVEFTPASGDSYTLAITTTAGATKTSTGQITDISGANFTLKHTGESATISVTVNANSSSGGTIISITGDIHIDYSTETITVSGTLTIGNQTTVTGIVVTTPPTKTQYSLGEELNTAGMVVTATYGDGSKKAVTEYAISGYVKTTLGNQTVTVTYIGKTATFTVNVIDNSKQTVATPAANPAAGTYNSAQSITLSCATTNATIYYTTNGNTPTETSSLYSGAISIAATTTLKAIAVKEGMNTSGVLTAVYTIQAGGGDTPGGNTPGTYIITGSGTSFTATKDSTTIGSGAIQDVIDGIRTHATGSNPTIQFGNGNVLDIGTATVMFYNYGGTWGAITLTGKITSSDVTINISDSVSVTSTADIKTSGNCNAIIHNSNGTLSISGGKVTSSANSLVSLSTISQSRGTIEITGGTVENTSDYWMGHAIHSGSNCTVNISGGTVSSFGIAVYCYSNCTVNISGGTVQSSGQAAVYTTVDNDSRNVVKVNISGGTVSATSGIAVLNQWGVVKITGGTVSATSGIAVYSQNNGGYETAYVLVSGTAKVTSANTDAKRGTIYLDNYYKYLELEITGGTLENTSTGTGNALYCNEKTSRGNIKITGGTISKAGTDGYAVYNGGTGTVTIGPGATVVGNKYGL